MSIPRLPSAEEFARSWGYEPGHNTMALLKAYARTVLKAAAQEALDHPEAPAEAILKLREN